MSIQSEINRINNNVQESLGICRDAGVSVASNANSDALPAAVAELAASGGGVSLPAGYIQVEYIESTGTQYIDTGVLYGTSNHRTVRIVSDAIVGTAENGWAVSGAGAGTTIYYGCGSNGRNMWYGDGANDKSTNVAYTNKRAVWDINHIDAYYRVAEKASGTVLVDIGISLSTPTAGTHPLYLFAYRWTNSAPYNAVCHNEAIFGCKIYADGALARNYVPCINQSGAAGLYDLVNGEFYGNAGSGTFITGPVVGVTPIEKGGTGATDAATARNNLGITPQNIGALPLAGGNMTGAGPVQYPVVGDPGRSQHYISAGGGYSANSGKYGVKLLCCDQPDAQTGMGQDLTNLPGGYELSIAGGRNADGNTGYISFAMHSVNSKVYDRLGYFDNGGNFFTKGQITEGGTALANKYAAKSEIPTDYLPKSGGTVTGELGISGKVTQGNPSGDSTVTSMNRFQADLFVEGNGSAPNKPKAAGFYLGKSSTDGNRHMDIVSGETYSYIDFNKAGNNLDYDVRLLIDVATGYSQFIWDGTKSSKALNVCGSLQQNGVPVATQNEILPNTGGTVSGPVKINGAEADDGSGQLAMFKALSTSNAQQSPAWIGRSMFGAKNLTFLVGTYNGMAGLGAHSWTDANAGTGAAWAPIYIQPDGGASAAVYIGQNGTGWQPGSGTLVVRGNGAVNQGSVEVHGMLTTKNQDPGSLCVRNTKLVSSDTNPTANGEICWTYK